MLQNSTRSYVWWRIAYVLSKDYEQSPAKICYALFLPIRYCAEFKKISFQYSSFVLDSFWDGLENLTYRQWGLHYEFAHLRLNSDNFVLWNGGTSFWITFQSFQGQREKKISAFKVQEQKHFPIFTTKLSQEILFLVLTDKESQNVGLCHHFFRKSYQY